MNAEASGRVCGRRGILRFVVWTGGGARSEPDVSLVLMVTWLGGGSDMSSGWRSGRGDMSICETWICIREISTFEFVKLSSS